MLKMLILISSTSCNYIILLHVKSLEVKPELVKFFFKKNTRTDHDEIDGMNYQVIKENHGGNATI